MVHHLDGKPQSTSGIASKVLIPYDYIVVGLGGHGSAAIAHLSKRGGTCLGLERFARESHSHGSSHGRSRIIRQAYFEAPQYVPLLKRAFELWRELQGSAASRPDHPLLTMTGGLMIGMPDSVVVKGTLASVRTHKLPHQVLTAQQIRQRFPGFAPRDDEIGVLETEAGYLIPELCVQAHCAVAESHGAELRFAEPLISWSDDAETGGVAVQTGQGRYTARKIVLAVGAWAPELYGREIDVRLHAARRVLYWFSPRVATDVFDQQPVYIWDLGAAGNFYGFPRQAGPPGGVKVAMHYVDPSVQTECTPETVDRSVSAREEAAMRAVLKDRIPLLDGDLVATATCMYTNTPDEHFLIDWHPQCADKVLLASPCSGHGFKFCSVVGEIIADLLMDGATSHDIDFFRLKARL